uniref:Uncharacterized protein n=1 Tax=viral metagenome TaxID=1070528 RepID=A0A6M3IW04_9ZZZZ
MTRNEYLAEYRTRPEYKTYRRKYWEENKEELNAQKRKYYAINKQGKEKKLASQKRYRQKLRNLVLNHYGKVCECCGESHIEFLGIDHILGGGSRHKKEIQGRLYYWLVNNNFPTGFRILCHNCNQALGAYGYCPHKIGG